MRRLRRSLHAIFAALVAALAVLFVTTAVMADEARPEAPMVMSGPEAPCEDMDGVSCQPHCAVLCQALVVEPMVVPTVVSPARTQPFWSPLVLEPIAPEAEDPPPRT